MAVRDIILALFVMTIWGVSFSVVTVGLSELPPILFVALRFLIVAVPAIFFVPFPKTSIWNVVSVGVLIGVIKFGLLFVAMNLGANAGSASLLLQAQVFFTIALSILVFSERATQRQVFGIGLAILGFAFFFVSPGGSISLGGLLLIILAALAWAAANIVMKNMPNVNLLHFMIWISTVPPLPLLAFSYVIETESPIEVLSAVSFQAWMAIAYMGYLSTLVAYAVWGALLSRYPASTVAPFALLIPIIGIGTASFWLGEGFSPLEFSGVALIMLGLVFCVLSDRSAEARVSLK